MFIYIHFHQPLHHSAQLIQYFFCHSKCIQLLYRAGFYILHAIQRGIIKHHAVDHVPVAFASDKPAFCRTEHCRPVFVSACYALEYLRGLPVDRQRLQFKYVSDQPVGNMGIDQCSQGLIEKF